MTRLPYGRRVTLLFHAPQLNLLLDVFLPSQARLDAEWAGAKIISLNIADKSLKMDDIVLLGNAVYDDPKNHFKLNFDIHKKNQPRRLVADHFLVLVSDIRYRDTFTAKPIPSFVVFLPACSHVLNQRRGDLAGSTYWRQRAGTSDGTLRQTTASWFN